MDAVAPRIAPTTSSILVGEMPLAIAEICLAGLPRGAVVVLCDEGRVDGFAVESMNVLAEHGYETVAASLSSVAGRPTTDEESLVGLTVLLDHMAGRGWSHEQIGIVGHGYGGRIALLGAATFRLGAAVSVSPTDVADDFVSDRAGTFPNGVVTPWLGLFGALAPAVPTAEVEGLFRRLWEASPAFVETVMYPGVEASFIRGPATGVGQAAMFDAWQRTLEWLNLRVVPRPSPFAEIWQLKKAMSL